MTTGSVSRLATLALATALFAAACGSDSLEVRTGEAGPEPTSEAPTDTPTDTPTEPTATPTEPSATPTEPSEPGSTSSDLDQAEARWEAADIADYDMTYREVCFCPEIRIMVTVRDGQVTETVSLGELDPDRPGRTVETLFAELRQAIDEGAVSVNVEYHPDLGYPTAYFIDFSEQIADEEFGITVESLTPVG